LDNECINPYTQQDLQDSEIEEGESKTEKLKEVKVMKDQLEISPLMQKRQMVGAHNPTVMEVPTEVHREQTTVSSQVAAEESSPLMQKHQTVGAENPTVTEVPTEVHRKQETVPSQVAAQYIMENFLRSKAKRKGRRKKNYILQDPRLL
jgi:hypothetical protein